MHSDTLNQPADLITGRPQRGLHWTLWAAQALLGLAFGFAGIFKSTAPIAELTQKMVWPGAMPEAMVRFIGVSELLGAVGLILPGVTKLKPQLTPLAACGLALIMLLAAAFHLNRGELSALPVNAVLGGIAAFIAWGRFRKVPLAAR